MDILEGFREAFDHGMKGPAIHKDRVQLVDVQRNPDGAGYVFMIKRAGEDEPYRFIEKKNQPWRAGISAAGRVINKFDLHLPREPEHHGRPDDGSRRHLRGKETEMEAYARVSRETQGET